MAMSPITRRDLDIFEDPYFHHGLEPRFGQGILPSDFNTSRIVSRNGTAHLPTGYHRPWAIAREASNELVADMKNLHIGKDGFQACVDVHHFKPCEITVKTVDNMVVVEGKHEERDDGLESVQRHFVRKYTLPKEYDMSILHSALSSDGVLTLKAPPPHAIANGERLVPITHSNVPVHLSVKENKPVDDKN